MIKIYVLVLCSFLAGFFFHMSTARQANIDNKLVSLAAHSYELGYLKAMLATEEGRSSDPGLAISEFKSMLRGD